MRKGLLIAGAILMLFTACKKSKPADEPVTPVDPVVVTPPGTALDLMRDSVYLYAKEDYYWYDGLPDYTTFNPRSFTGTTDLAALQAEVFKLSQYKTNPATGFPYEYYIPSPASRAKYSYIDDGTSSSKLNAVSGDFGFGLVYYLSNNDLRVKYVYAGSPAAAQGLKRGYQIISINGRTDLAGNIQANLDFINNAYGNSSTITLGLKRQDGTTFNATITAATYTINPVILTKVLDQGNGKKIGYIVFNSFVILSNVQAALDAAFSTFVTAGVTDLVIDLRYNGGGYVETAEYLSNLIAPTSANGKTMYTTYYNTNLQTGKDPMLKNQVRRDPTYGLFNYTQLDFSTTPEVFSKKGSLSIGRVFFIVTSGTASASELTINNLRPYMNVQLIGRTTYGKPVGFFDIKINKYEMYIAEFETKNASGQGGYYLGMAPGTTDYPGKDIVDDVSKEFGDPTEKLLAQAISYVNTGVYTASTDLQIQSTETGGTTLSTESINQKVGPAEFNGMIRQHYKLKK